MTHGRKVGPDALRILATLMVVMSHLMPYMGGSNVECYLDITNPGNLQEFGLVFVRNLGQFGNGIFIVISSWFLLDSKRFNIKKTISLEFDVWVISVAILGIYLIAGVPLGRKEIVKVLFPTLSGVNWFVTCYVIYYFIYPMLNMIVRQMDQRQHLLAVLGMMGYCVLGDRFPVYFTRLAGFICVHFVVAYFKLYLRDLNNSIKWNLIFIGISALGIVTGVFIGLLFFHNTLAFNLFANPFYILGAIGLLNLSNQRSVPPPWTNWLKMSPRCRSLCM